MPWLARSSRGAARRLGSGVVDSRTVVELRRRALEALAQLVPADVLTWDRVELATGAIRHHAVPVEVERPGAYEAVVGSAARHPLLAAHAARRRAAVRLSDVVALGVLTRGALYGDLLHATGVEYEIAIGMRSWSRRGGRRRARTDGASSSPSATVTCSTSPIRASRARCRPPRPANAWVGCWRPTRCPGTAVVLLDGSGEIVLSSSDAERWLAEHFGPAEHPGWLPAPVAEWLALPPRPPLVSKQDGRRLTVRLLPGDPHALLLEEEVATFSADALDRLGLVARESEVLRAAAVIDDEAELASELFLSLHAVRERLERIEAKLDVHTAKAAVARALRESE